MSNYLAQTHTPLRVSPENKDNVTDLVVERVARAPEHCAFRIHDKENGVHGYREVATGEFVGLVKAVSKGLHGCWSRSR